MNDTIRGYLIKNYKYGIPETDMYNKIQEWENWYKNNVEFHEYLDAYGKKRHMYTLGMAKRLCEDWSSIIYTEKDEITTNKKNNEKFIKDFIKKIRLDKEIPRSIEKSAWSGTCGAIIRLKNIKIDKNNKIVATEKTDYDYIGVSAKNIIPLRIEHDKVVDVAFVSDIYEGDKKYHYIEIHQLKDEGYVIYNKYLNAKTGQEEKPENIKVISEMHTMSKIPLFSILEPPIENNIDNNLGLGISIYGNAIDQLKDCDVKYHNSVMDFVLGGKKIIYNKKLVKYKDVKVKNADGTYTTTSEPIYPDDVSKQQFMEIGDNIPKDELIYEYNPSLRPDENTKGIQFSLDLLSFKANLGTKYYEFSDGNVVTATQYVGDRQDLMKNAKKYRDNLDEFIADIIKAGLLLGRLVFGKNVTEECNIEVVNKDGILITDEEIKQKYLEEISQGLRQPYEYRMKFFGEDEETARRMIEDQKTEE